MRLREVLLILLILLAAAAWLLVVAPVRADEGRWVWIPKDGETPPRLAVLDYATPCQYTQMVNGGVPAGAVWSSCGDLPMACRADVNGDGMVTLSDLGILLRAYNDSCEGPQN